MTPSPKESWRCGPAFVNGEDNISFETLTFLSGWLSNHILESDADFGRFAAKRQRTTEPDYL